MGELVGCLCRAGSWTLMIIGGSLPPQDILWFHNPMTVEIPRGTGVGLVFLGHQKNPPWLQEISHHSSEGLIGIFV